LYGQLTIRQIKFIFTVIVFSHKSSANALTLSLILIFLMESMRVVAQPARDATLNWKHKTKGAIVSAPVYHDYRVYIGSYDSIFYCFQAASGKILWQYKTNGQIGSTATIADGKIYFFSGDGKLYCLNAVNGQPLWTFKTFTGALPDRRYDWPDYYQSSPVIDQKVVYLGAGDGRIYAIHAESGTLKWSFPTGDVVHTKPAMENEKLVVGSFDGNMYCLNKDTGSLIWRFKTTGQRYFPRGEINGDPVIHNNKVLFGARDYNLYALDLEGGYCHWLKTFPYGWALPITPNDSVIYAGTSDDRLLLAMDEDTGAILWQANLGFNIFAGMVVANNTGVTGTLNGKLFCVDLIKGNILWEFETDGYKAFARKYFREDGNYVPHIGKLLPNGTAILRMYEELGAIFSSPVIHDGNIFFASNDGTLYSIRRK